MSFELTEEQQSLQRTVRKFAEKELAPIAAEADEKSAFHREIYDKLADIGLLGIPCPEEYGGAGLDYLTYIVVVEEIARHCLATAIGLGVQGLPQIMINLFGSEQQKKTYLEPLALGEKLGAFALTEPSSGSDAAALKTTAAEPCCRATSKPSSNARNVCVFGVSKVNFPNSSRFSLSATPFIRSG